MTAGHRVVVVGSGAAGLSAALGAAAAGSDVVVLEGDDTVGGTTALSGGVAWFPASDAMKTAGLEDSVADALHYLEVVAAGDVDAGLMATFASDAGRVAGEIERRTPLRWEVLVAWPDYHGELSGARSGGRSLWPTVLALPAAIEVRVHGAPDQPRPVGTGDERAPGAGHPGNDGVVFRGPVRGRALVGALLAGVEAAGIEVRTGTRATGLDIEGEAVIGVRVDNDVVPGGVVLATGGYQHDPGLVASYLPGVPVAAMGTPGCVGDGLRMALSAHAAVGNMSEGWWMPALQVPGELLDGAPYYRPLHAERAYPGALMVDADGRRFVNEAQNYGDVGRAMAGVGAPWWLVFDATCRQRYPVGPVNPDDPDPPWLPRAPDVSSLAGVIGVPAPSLASTIDTFNDAAQRGEDPAFGRGTLPYDRWIGDARASHPTLAPLRQAPFYAVPVHLGCMGTKGGPRTDDRGRVLSVDGGIVRGLYAAGNVAANPFGSATPAGGGTLGPAIVFGFRAGEAAGCDR